MDYVSTAFTAQLEMIAYNWWALAIVITYTACVVNRDGNILQAFGLDVRPTFVDVREKMNVHANLIYL